MSFPLSDVVETCPCCGQIVGDLSSAFEELVAGVLEGEVAPVNNEGYDVYRCGLFPGLLVQVKVSTSSPRGNRHKGIFVSGWSWKEGPIEDGVRADVYVLFGIHEGDVYPFVLSKGEWLSVATISSRGACLGITAYRAKGVHVYGHGYTEGYRYRHWQYYVKGWPEGFIERVQFYQPTRKGRVRRARERLQMSFLDEVREVLDA